MSVFGGATVAAICLVVGGSIGIALWCWAGHVVDKRRARAAAERAREANTLAVGNSGKLPQRHPARPARAARDEPFAADGLAGALNQILEEGGHR